MRDLLFATVLALAGCVSTPQTRDEFKMMVHDHPRLAMVGSHLPPVPPSPLEAPLEPPLLDPPNTGAPSVDASNCPPSNVRGSLSSPHATTMSATLASVLADATKPNPFSMSGGSLHGGRQRSTPSRSSDATTRAPCFTGHKAVSLNSFRLAGMLLEHDLLRGG